MIQYHFFSKTAAIIRLELDEAEFTAGGRREQQGNRELRVQQTGGRFIAIHSWLIWRHGIDHLVKGAFVFPLRSRGKPLLI